MYSIPFNVARRAFLTVYWKFINTYLIVGEAWQTTDNSLCNSKGKQFMVTQLCGAPGPPSDSVRGGLWPSAPAHDIISAATSHSTTTFALGLLSLDAAGLILPQAAGRVPLLVPLLLDLPVYRLVPAHARSVLSTQVDQVELQILLQCESMLKYLALSGWALTFRGLQNAASL